MARFGTITIEEVLASTKTRLQIRTTDSDIFLLDQINEGVRHLDALSVFTQQQCVIEIEDNKSKLPCGFWQLISLRFGEGNTCQEMIYADLDWLSNCGCDVNQINNFTWYTSTFQISDGYIFYHQLPADTTSATISFMGLNVDSLGRGIIYEDYRRALVSYACYIYCLQNMDENKYRSQMDIHRQTWEAQKRWIKSNDVYNQFHNEKHQIRSIMNSWVADKRNFRTI